MHQHPGQLAPNRLTRLRKPCAAGLLMLFCAAAAQAHTEGGVASGFLSGFMHPLSGPRKRESALPALTLLPKRGLIVW